MHVCAIHNIYRASSLTVISNISLDCNLGASSITVFATDPNSETLEYALNGSNYQSSNTFTTIPNGNYTVAVRNTISSCVVAQSFTVDCFPIINITPQAPPPAPAICAMPLLILPLMAALPPTLIMEQR